MTENNLLPEQAPSMFGQPLAARMRPSSLDEIAGQQHLLGEGKVLRRLISSDNIGSMIFWGPPGVGKTTLARVIALQTKASFIDFSAVNSGIKEIRQVMNQAEENRVYGVRTIVFVDEIHRYNKAQQDAFLPFVEKGSIVLIGATTENPSFEVNSALLSRCKVFVLHALSREDILTLLHRALTDERGFGREKVEISENALGAIADFSNGDARSALSSLEMVVLNGEAGADGIRVTDEIVAQCLSRKNLMYDKDGEEHYNLISALHKSMRNSDPDAAVYWMMRMLEGGEDPLYIARRVLRFAAEDVGLADPRAMEVGVAAYQACHFIGVPECNVHLAEAVVYMSLASKSNVHLAEAVVYMSLASKSNAMEMAVNEAREAIEKEPDAPVPLVIRNAPTRLMKDLSYGKGYQYAHDYEEKITAMQCLPDALKDRQFYHPTDQGQESRYKERLEQIRAWKKEHRK